MIAAHAARLGIVVARPMIEGRRYDLIFDVDGQLSRVQCKWGSRTGDVVVAHTGTCRLTPTGYLRTTYTDREIDAIAIYCQDVDTCYYLPIDEVAERHVVHLRLAPARNNQRSGVKMAAQYEFGAIAQLGERRHGMAEVVGSSPTSSTEEQAAHQGGLFSF